MQAVVAAVQAGDYAAAYAALLKTPESRTPAGAAVGAFLLALVERFDDAQRLMQSANLQGFEVLLNGERQRTARWRDPGTQGALASFSPTPLAPCYAALASAFITNNEILAQRAKADLAQHARPIAGRVTFTNGQVEPFASATDCDDAIGQTLETYCGQGLLYFPFDALRRVEMLPKTNFMDYLVPKAKLITDRGEILAFVPLLYATSALSAHDTVRNGGTTMFSYLGEARRAIGHRDFMFDQRLVGLGSIAAIDFAQLQPTQ